MMRYSKRTVNIVHALQFILIHGVLAIGVYRLFDKSIVSSRTDRWSLGVCAKSMIVLSYQVMTEHVQKLRRFRSLKANFILNIVETVFWGALAYFSASSLINTCQGLGCTLSGITLGLSIVLIIMSLIMVAYSFIHWRRPESDVKQSVEAPYWNAQETGHRNRSFSDESKMMLNARTSTAMAPQLRMYSDASGSDRWMEMGGRPR